MSRIRERDGKRWLQLARCERIQSVESALEFAGAQVALAVELAHKVLR